MDTDTSETSSEDKKFSRTLESFNKVVDPSLDIDPFLEVGIDILKWFYHTCVSKSFKIWAEKYHKQGVYVSFWQFYFISVHFAFICFIHTEKSTWTNPN